MYGSETWTFRDVVLEQKGEDQIDGQSDKQGGATKSRPGKDFKGHYYQEERKLDLRDSEQSTKSTTRRHRTKNLSSEGNGRTRMTT